jgi:hypothetical protein
MIKHRTTEVFVPGGMPEHTYVPRSEHRLEERLNASKHNLCKLVTVTGTTKSGKTVLTRRVFPQQESVWVDGGSVGSEDDFWSYILNEIGGHTSTVSEEVRQSEHGLEGGVEGALQLPLFAKASGKFSTNHRKSHSKSEAITLAMTPRAAAVSQLRDLKIPLIIDDFHYLDRSFQGNIIRALKPLVFEGIPIILIAIPHRRYDAVKVEREMTGRLEPINIPVWEPAELAMIADQGFPLLNLDISACVLDRLVSESYGSPHLMQEFCRTLTQMVEVEETLPRSRRIESVADELFSHVAEHTGKVIFDKLAKGPRQRRDRIPRKLKNGETADIYEVTLLALASLKPGLETVDYESLRTSIRDVLADNIPQAREVTRVLEKMAEIASSDEASTPVLDWEKADQRLHITDPFFAFYLKWGVKLV